MCIHTYLYGNSFEFGFGFGRNGAIDMRMIWYDSCFGFGFGRNGPIDMRMIWYDSC